MAGDNADVFTADTADVFAADNADVLAADTTDVLAADKYVADGKAADGKLLGCWLLVVLQKSRCLFYKKSNRFGQTFWAWNTRCQQSINNPSKNHPKTGNLFVTMEVHIAPNQQSPAGPGPDFRPGCQENTPGGHVGHQNPQNHGHFWICGPLVAHMAPGSIFLTSGPKIRSRACRRWLIWSHMDLHGEKKVASFGMVF